MNTKIRNLKEIVQEIPDGAELALGGFAITRNPIAFVCELIRQQKKDLKVYEIIGGMDSDLLIGAGCVKEFSYGGGSLDRFGRINRINEAIEQGTVDVREYSGLSISLRFLAGSLGVPYIPSKTLLGTDILQNLLDKDDAVKTGQNVFDDEKYVFLKALQPEYAVIHAPCADSKGNVMIEGPVWDVELAKSAKKLIVTVDKIVSNEYIKQHSVNVVIPSVCTYAIVEVPYGGYPTSVYKNYDYDGELLARYAKLNKRQDTFDAFVKEYILGTDDHHGFMSKICSLEKICRIQVDPAYGYHKELR
jgi:glutaconate CoA-transferase, subunit A